MKKNYEQQTASRWTLRLRATTLSLGAFFFSSLIFFFFVSLPAASAQEGVFVSGESESVWSGAASRVQTGTVGAMGPDGLALVYYTDPTGKAEKEMWLPFEEDVKYIGYAGKHELQEGDSVTVTFDETGDGAQRRLRVVNLIRHAPPKVVVEDAAPSTEGEEAE